jgi:hypothetical protein
MIQNLSSTNKDDHGDDQSPQSMWQRAERARAILEAMELFDELRDIPDLPIPLPLATHETYWNVLRLYASKFVHGTAERNAPQRCFDIVQRMKDSNSQRKGLSGLQPTSVHWNQVLSAYANSGDDERPLKAAQLLYQLDEQGLTDASSFSHTLRCCVSMSSREQRSTKAFQDLAVSVAVRVWRGLQQHTRIERESYHFVHMLRVCRNFHRHEETTKRDALAQQTFHEAIEARKVNVHVLQELLQVASPKLMQQILPGSKTKTKNYSKDPLQLIRQVPTEWIEQHEPTAGDGNQKKNPYEW